MARIATTLPEVIRSPVRVTDEHYDLYYAKPVLLGKITKIGHYWFTDDGTRFIASRDALDYLAKIRNQVEQELGLEKLYNQRAGNKERQQGAQARQSQPLLRKKKPDISQEELHKLITALGYTKPAAENGK